MEPLSFKGRRGSGLKGNRTGLIKGPKWDWEYYLDTYRAWGRPEQAKPDPSSRILPLITTAHCPSAANNNYWPEMYTNQPMVDGVRHQYSDTPTPRTFGNVSPLDPQLFSRINDFGRMLKERAASTRPSRSRNGWRTSRPKRGRRRPPLAVSSQPSSVWRSCSTSSKSTGDRAALKPHQAYRAARDTWAKMANDDQGLLRCRCDCWRTSLASRPLADRLAAIDADIAAAARSYAFRHRHRPTARPP